jgi:Fe-S-cluster containining protein
MGELVSGNRMNRKSEFSYVCNACGRCCHDKVITLSPYDVLRLAQAAGVSMREAVARYTIRRGSILKFSAGGACAALEGTRCGLHRGRPLACRLYPLGIERREGSEENFVLIEPAVGSLGLYDIEGTVDTYLASQAVAEYIDANARYESLLPIFRERIAAIVDFDRVEPREFWRRATREALAESNYDPNPMIDAMFDALVPETVMLDIAAIVAAHIERLARMIRHESDGATLAAAAVMLAVSLGFSPHNVM